ncbi:GNAT family N-acetyltransferase [Candidatus Dependentiae bacterium]
MYIYAYYIILLLYLYISMTVNNCIIQNIELYSERTKTMNNQKPFPPKIAGKFTTNDKFGVPVVIEWQKTSLIEPKFATAMKDVWELTRKAFIPVEMKFLRAYPQVVSTEDYFKPFEPLFKNGLENVDWRSAEKTMEALLKSHQIFDASTLSADLIAMFAKDIYYFVTIKDQRTNALHGYITFKVRSNYVKGVMSIAVDPACQNRGLGKLLMSSIFKIKPDIKHFFLCTRVTNDTARNAYMAWGFTKDNNPIMDHKLNPKHWIFFEYKIKQINILQKTAERLINLL